MQAMQKPKFTIGYIFNPETIYEITVDTKDKFYITNLKTKEDYVVWLSLAKKNIVI
jgi:hypothetical protein